MGDVLARKPAGEHIDRSESGVDLSDVGGNRDGRPVSMKNGAGSAVVFARPRELESGVVEAEVKATAS